MPDGRRQFSRVAVQIPALIELPGRPKSDGRRLPAHRVHADVTSLSPGGLRLATHEQYELPLGASAHVKMTITLGDETLSLPVALLWCRHNDGESSDFGGRLLLEIADATSRQFYARWIVSQLTTQPAARARG